MNERDFLIRIGEILQQSKPLSKNDVLADIPEWDSLSQITVVAFFKNTLHKPIPFDTVKNAKCVGDLLEFFVA